MRLRQDLEAAGWDAAAVGRALAEHGAGQTATVRAGIAARLLKRARRQWLASAGGPALEDTSAMSATRIAALYRQKRRQESV
jgi:hypothetical protein